MAYSRKGTLIRKLSIIQLGIAVTSIIVGIIQLIKVNHWSSISACGIWVGVWIFMSGLYGCYNSTKRYRSIQNEVSWIIRNTLFSVITELVLVLSTVFMVLIILSLSIALWLTFIKPLQSDMTLPQVTYCAHEGGVVQIHAVLFDVHQPSEMMYLQPTSSPIAMGTPYHYLQRGVETSTNNTLQQENNGHCNDCPQQLSVELPPFPKHPHLEYEIPQSVELPPLFDIQRPLLFGQRSVESRSLASDSPSVFEVQQIPEPPPTYGASFPNRNVQQIVEIPALSRVCGQYLYGQQSGESRPLTSDPPSVYEVQQITEPPPTYSASTSNSSMQEPDDIPGPASVRSHHLHGQPSVEPRPLESDPSCQHEGQQISVPPTTYSV